MVIQESTIRDIVDLLMDLKNIDPSKVISKPTIYNTRSITQATAALTCVFPVVIPSDITIDTASMITKAVERRAVSMLQMIFAASVATSDNALEYLKSIHTNMDLSDKMSLSGIMDLISDVKGLRESGMEVEFYDNWDKMKSIMEDYKLYDTDINENSISDYKIIPKGRYGSISIINEARRGSNTPSKRAYSKSNNYADEKNEREKNEERRRESEFNMRAQKYQRDEMRAKAEEERREKEELRRQSKAEYDKNEDKRKNIKAEYDKNEDRRKEAKARYDASEEMRRRAKETRDVQKDNIAVRKDLMSIEDMRLKNNILSSDVKKANELVPTMMVVHLINPNSLTPMSFVIGIKAKMIVINSGDIADRLVIRNKDDNAFNKLLRVSTGELNFLKDFLFAIDRAKLDALSQSRKGSSNKFFKVLERRAAKSKLRRRMGSRVNDAKAITTMVVSEELASLLLREHDLDINKPEVIRPIMESMNLMQFVIVDEVNEYAKFLVDTGDDIYEYSSYSSLERESNDNSFKKVINLMGKINK